MDWVTEAQLKAFVSAHAGGVVRQLQLKSRSLRGGLISASVRRVDAKYRDESDRWRSFRFVIKELCGEHRREAVIYEALSRTPLCAVAPRLLRVEHLGGMVRLYLESVAVRESWPWRRLPSAQRVLSRLAELHTDPRISGLEPHLSDWDYDAELRQRTESLLEQLTRSREAFASQGLSLRLGRIRRLGEQLPRLRQQLASYRRLGTTVLHGDVHPGNVLLQRRGGQEEPILLDWGRARSGSPLEDVSSWLQSLAYWEPQAKRRHDSLLATYLRARGLSVPPSRELRDAYWLAAGCNALAGALQYHAAVALDPRRTERARKEALRAARDQLRVLRRADACCSA